MRGATALQKDGGYPGPEFGPDETKANFARLSLLDLAGLVKESVQ